MYGEHVGATPSAPGHGLSCRPARNTCGPRPIACHNSRRRGALAASPALYAALAFLAFLQLTALVLTLLPIPGLDGWGIVEPCLPRAWREFGTRVGGIAPALLFLSFLLVPAMNQMFWRLVYNLCKMIGLGADFAIKGLLLFQFWR